MKCQYCKSICVKNGKQKDGTQKYRCKGCGKWQQEEYKYNAKILEERRLITRFLTRNAGFRGIASGLEMAVNTVMKVMYDEAKKLKEPLVSKGCVYEVDEMKAHGKKGKTETWVVYGVERKSKKVLGISVGKRIKTVIKRTTEAIQKTSPKRIYTDGYPTYKSLIPERLHKVSKKMLCHVERKHLTARNGLKMLNRKTLSFVRKPSTLVACLKLLFWGEKC